MIDRPTDLADDTSKVRTCPACEHDHAAGTTCGDCCECRAKDLVSQAKDVLADLLPGGADWREALVQHNQNLGLRGRCDGDCHLDDCRLPQYDESGLTQYSDTSGDQDGVPVFGQREKR